MKTEHLVTIPKKRDFTFLLKTMLRWQKKFLEVRLKLRKVITG